MSDPTNESSSTTKQIIQPRSSSNSIWSLACHFSAYGMFFFPFGNLVGPLIVWLAKRDQSEAINQHGKASLNFQLTMTLVFLGYTVLFAAFVFGLIGAGAIDMIKGEHLDQITAGIVTLIIGTIASVFIGVLTTLYYWVMIAVNGIRAYDGKDSVYVPSICFVS
jgi:uncharacterized Tic20 family protein